MKHDWLNIGGTKDYPFRKIRWCKNCGIAQERENIQSWGRIIGYKWYPKAGRCCIKPEVEISHEILKIKISVEVR